MNLAELQRQMAAAVMQPLTPDEDMRATAPDGRPMSELAESFIAPNSKLSPFERLEIYNRQYWYRVTGALAEWIQARGVAGRQSASCRTPPSPGSRCGAHRVGVC
jgi:hypothetical protein